jgi:CRP-like cAMP-binding protein
MWNTLTTPEMLVYAAGGCYILGLLIIHQVTLRVLVLVGTCLYLFYYATAADEPLWAAIYTTILIGVANVIGLASLMAGRSKLAIPRRHADIYTYFPTLPPGDFRRLMSNAERSVLQEDTFLTHEDAPAEHLYFVVSGKIQILKRGERFERAAGIFIGEVAYLTGSPASASVVLKAGSEVLSWKSSTLRASAARSTQFQLALGSALSLDMAQKVSNSVGHAAELQKDDGHPNLTAVP